MGFLGPTLVVLTAVAAFVFFKQPSMSRVILVDQVAEEYDYIVVGGGSAGSVVAARLAEDEGYNVLLLEAGGFFDENPDFHIPVFWPNMLHTDHDWDYSAEPQETASLGLKQGRSYWPRGRVLGGTSVINALQYTRGSPFEYDQWAANGCTGWSYKDVLPYFLKSEDILIPELKSSKYHSSGGPLPVSTGGVSKMADFYLKAGEELGYEITDYNGADQQGFSMAQVTAQNGVRSSTGLRFLGSSKKRENLDIAVRSIVTKIDIKDKRAVGLYFNKNGVKKYVKAKKEIVLSAGAINSPQLLMLSGIGPTRHLAEMNIPVVADLPVGQNLQDHQMAMMYTSINKPHSLSADVVLSWWSWLQYNLFGSGPLTSSGIEGSAFLHLDKSMKGKASPDIHVIFFSSYVANNIFNVDDTIAKEYFAKSPNEHGFGSFLCLTHPRSKGEIRLKTKDPFDYPIINANYLTDRRDVEQLIGGIRFWEDLLETETMKDLGSDINRMKLSICAEHNFRSDAYWECFVRHLAVTVYHHSGTCKMGPDGDTTAVVDPQLEYGVSKDCELLMPPYFLTSRPVTLTRRLLWSRKRRQTSYVADNSHILVIQADHFYGFFRILPSLKIFYITIMYSFQAACITMRVRRCVTRRLIGIRAVKIYHHSFFRSPHNFIFQNIWIFHGPVLNPCFSYLSKNYTICTFGY